MMANDSDTSTYIYRSGAPGANPRLPVNSPGPFRFLLVLHVSKGMRFFRLA